MFVSAKRHSIQYIDMIYVLLYTNITMLQLQQQRLHQDTYLV